MQFLSSNAFTRDPISGHITCNANAHEILNLVAKADYDGRLFPSIDLQESRLGIHRFYDNWYPLHCKLNQIEETEDLIGRHFFLAKYPEIDYFSGIIAQLAINCYYTLISPVSIPFSYTELYRNHYSLLMMITASIFRNEGFPLDEPEIFESYPDEPWPPVNYKSPIEVQQEPDAPL